MPALATNAPLLYAAELMQDYAHTDYTRAATQHTIMETLQAKQKMDADQQAQQRTTQYLSALSARDAAMMAAGKDPGKNDPNTTSVSDDSVTSPIEQTIKDLQGKFKNESELARLAEENGAFAQSKEHETRAKDYATQLREAQTSVMKQKRDNMKEIANVMRDVNGPEALQSALSQIQSQFGKGARDKVDAQLPHDPYTLEPVWNDKAKQVIARYASQFKDAGVKMQEEAHKATDELGHQRLEEEKARDKERVRKDDADIAHMRNGDAIQRRREDRLQKSATARIDNANKKAEKAKDPNSSEAKATAKLLTDQLDMPPEIAGKAAYDYLRRRADAINDGEDTDEAEQSALDYVTGKFSKGEKGQRNWFSPDVPAKPAVYGAKPTAAGGGNVIQFSDLK